MAGASTKIAAFARSLKLPFPNKNLRANRRQPFAYAINDFALYSTSAGKTPPGLFIQPHGRLEEMEQKADLVFNGQVISNTEITNSSFTVSSLAVQETRFNVISILKGPSLTNVFFVHYAGYGKYGLAWDGPSPPAMHKLEVGQSYLVFAMRMDKPDSYYSPPPEATNTGGVLRQIADVPKSGDDAVLKTLDQRRLASLSIKEAHWLELSRLLNDSMMGDKDDNLRAGAVTLLSRFQPPFREQYLRVKAGDSSRKVRAAVADTIGGGNIRDLIPILDRLWADTNIVHTSAGNALLQFDLDQVSGLLKAHLNAEDFHEKYLCRLAEPDAGPWLTNLVEVLKVRREVNWQKAVTSGVKETTSQKLEPANAGAKTSASPLKTRPGFLAEIDDHD